MIKQKSFKVYNKLPEPEKVKVIDNDLLRKGSQNIRYYSQDTINQLFNKLDSLHVVVVNILEENTKELNNLMKEIPRTIEDADIDYEKNMGEIIDKIDNIFTDIKLHLV